MSKDITDELIIREETSGYSFEKSKGNMDEDIKILEDFIYEIKSFGLTKDTLEVSYAIENLIKAYKDQNGIIKTANIAIKDLQEKLKNYIPVSLVEEKIEELNEYYKKEIYPSLINWSDVDVTEYYDGMISVLQELLEKR